MSLRNWADFADSSKLKLPSFSHCHDLVAYNLNYFQINYLLIFAVFIVVFTYFNPSLFAGLGFAALVFFGNKFSPKLFPDRRLPGSEVQRYWASIAAGLLLVYLFSGFVLLWCSLTTAVVVLGHALTRSQRDIKHNTFNAVWSNFTNPPRVPDLAHDITGHMMEQGEADD
eukprot:gnl/Spiro4/26835_TR13340_c0_g1_i1.p1 gnl/Spiro4/26835_TR13340_c0_g1~~gnl/Spiro4/26835_TR13340_c0_g1_i1.p1  ORF type:complete len:191 (-),score=39.61 gnl/Spiro4/26835_TR13340_c0_g1_i1:124-633(-)